MSLRDKFIYHWQDLDGCTGLTVTYLRGKETYQLRAATRFTLTEPVRRVLEMVTAGQLEEVLEREGVTDKPHRFPQWTDKLFDAAFHLSELEQLERNGERLMKRQGRLNMVAHTTIGLQVVLIGLTIINLLSP